MELDNGTHNLKTSKSKNGFVKITITNKKSDNEQVVLTLEEKLLGQLLDVIFNRE